MAAIPSVRAPLTEPVDVLLADVALRLQLSPSNYRLAVERYETISQWLDRDGSPLQGRVQLLYPQGSMAIGATTRAIVGEDFDIDVIAQLDLPADLPPHKVLNLLEDAIRGERGSRYFELTARHSRCVQVRYGNQMHVDVTPMLRSAHSPEREGLIMHAPDRTPTPRDAALVANPYGFAQWFLARTPPEAEFARAFAMREREYEAALKADAEPVPEQEPVQDKSLAVITLQLLKRWVARRYANRSGRCPASVLLARLVGEAAGHTSGLLEELIYQARWMRVTLQHAHGAGQLIDVRNPVCAADDFTDRWPANLSEQQVFLNDLDDLLRKLERLAGECTLEQMRQVLGDLFGEEPAREAIVALNRRTGGAIATGRSKHEPQGGRFALAGSAVVAATASATVRATPPHTNFGGE
jgi:hypothetical protein